MRLRAGRPDLAVYAHLFGVPGASATSTVTVTFLGVSTLLISDGSSAVHTHFDHALDSGVVAELTGAALVGGRSAANVGRGAGLAENRILVANHGDALDLGTFTVEFLESEHCPPDRFPGTIDAPLRPPA